MSEIRPARGVMLAKGESRRLPGKNRREFAGVPMFLHNLQKMIHVGLDPILDSDDAEILELAASIGATPHERNTELLGPDVPTLPIVESNFAAFGIEAPTCAVIVQANSPNISINTIRRTTEMITRCDLNEIMSAHPNKSHNGSVWAVSHDRLTDYGDYYTHRPDALIVDDSVDIHLPEDLAVAEAMHTSRDRRTYFDVKAPPASISQAYER